MPFVEGVACPAFNSSGNTGGFVSIANGDTTALSLAEQGGGCSIGAIRQGNVITANGASCVFPDQGGLNAIGVVSKQYDTFKVDLATSRWAYRYRLVWKGPEGPMLTCVEADLPITMVQ